MAISLDSDLFMFETHDDWCDRIGSLGDGYSLFKEVNDKMVGVYTTDQSVPQYEDVEKYLLEKEVKKLFTLSIPHDGYFGLRADNDCGDGDFMGHRQIGEDIVESLADSGIDVISLTS